MSNASSQEVKLFAEGWKELKAKSVFEIRASYLARDLLLSAENLRVAFPEPGTCPIPQLS
jgi:Zn-dependent peptidase ImmA (M78 family)